MLFHSRPICDRGRVKHFAALIEARKAAFALVCLPQMALAAQAEASVHPVLDTEHCLPRRRCFSVLPSWRDTKHEAEPAHPAMSPSALAVSRASPASRRVSRLGAAAASAKERVAAGANAEVFDGEATSASVIGRVPVLRSAGTASWRPCAQGPSSNMRRRAFTLWILGEFDECL